jgi:hypothetical protein
MRSVTIHLAGYVEEREREEKWRTRKTVALVAVLALLGVAAVARPEPEVRTVEKLVPVPTTVTETITETIAETVIEYVRVPGPGPRQHEEPLPIHHRFADLRGSGVAEIVAARHLCISPKWIRFENANEAKITISNPSTREVTITGVARFGDRKRSGFDLERNGCIGRKLGPGEQCQMTVTLRERIGETVQLVVSNDMGETESMAIAAAELE